MDVYVSFAVPGPDLDNAETAGKLQRMGKELQWTGRLGQPGLTGWSRPAELPLGPDRPMPGPASEQRGATHDHRRRVAGGASRPLTGRLLPAIFFSGSATLAPSLRHGEWIRREFR